MPVPIIAAGAAAVAARLAAKKLAQEAAKKAAKAAAAKTAQIAKNSVVKKPAAKPVGNPPNSAKMEAEKISSYSRGGRFGPLGKDKTKRVVSSKNPTADSARAAALRAAKNKALANSAKGKTQTPTAEAARRRNLNK